MNNKFDIDQLRYFAENVAQYYPYLTYDTKDYYPEQNKINTDQEKIQRDFREENAQLRDKLLEASSYIKELEGFFEEIKDGPSSYAYVIKTHGNRVTVSTNTGIIEIPNTPKTEMPKIGDGVMFGSGIIIGPAQEITTGDLFIVTDYNKEEGWAEISVDGSPRRIVCALQVESGDRVLVDDNNTIALKNYGKNTTKFSFDGDTGISWDDIGGLENAKLALKEAIELPNKYPELFKKYNKRIPKGAMLYGPSGTGKTLLAKAAATSLAKTYGKSAKNTGFIYVKGPELLSMWVGNTEAEIRGLFARGREHYKKNGYPAILFIDEADALLGARVDSKSSDRNLSNTIVPQFLSEMDGLEDSGVFVLLATNRPEILDSAITRDGRIDRKVAVLRPNEKAAKDILRIHIKNRPVSVGTDLETLIDHSISYLYGEKFSLYEVTYNRNNPNKKIMFLKDLVNGAMIAGIAERSASIAMNRDIENALNGVKENDGISVSNVYEAIDTIYKENIPTNHDLAIQEFCESLNGDIINIQRV